MSTRIDQLARILQFSVTMLDSARDRRWDELPALEAERAHMLRDYAAMPAPGDTNDAAVDAEAEILGRIIEANAALIELGERHCGILTDELTGTRRQRHAASMYSRSSTLPHFPP